MSQLSNSSERDQGKHGISKGAAECQRVCFCLINLTFLNTKMTLPLLVLFLSQGIQTQNHHMAPSKPGSWRVPEVGVKAEAG